MNKEDIVSALEGLRRNATFLTLCDYVNNYGETSDVSIVFHVSYASALNKSIEMLSKVDPASELEAKAKEELLVSFRNSLASNEGQEDEAREDNAYMHFLGGDDRWIKGVKLHLESNTLHLYGIVAHKRISIPGVYKAVNSRPLTIAKDKLRSKLPISKWRQYKITGDKVRAIKVEGLDLLPPEY